MTSLAKCLHSHQNGIPATKAEIIITESAHYVAYGEKAYYFEQLILEGQDEKETLSRVAAK